MQAIAGPADHSYAQLGPLLQTGSADDAAVLKRRNNKDRKMRPHRGFLVFQDRIKIWAKLLAELHEVFVLTRLGLRVARLGLF